MPFPNIDPVAFAIGPFMVRWYALGYLAGVGLGAGYGYLLLANSRLWQKGEPPFAAKEIWDFAFWTMLAIVVGGRVGYILFYNLPMYLANPLEMLNTLDGGMSYHGGMLGLMLAVVLFTWKKGTGNWLSGLDLIASVSTIGIFLVRIANFINAELYGAPTNVPWAVVFPTDELGLPRHPSQLYEAALEGLLLFLVIRIFTHVFYALRRPGLVAGIFGIGYGLSRIAVEFVRLPDEQLGYLYGTTWITQGMVLSVPMVVAGLGLVIWAMTRKQSLLRTPA